MSDFKNTFIAIVLAVLVMLGWQFFYENPKLEARQAELERQNRDAASQKQVLHSKKSAVSRVGEVGREDKTLEEIRASAPRVHIESDLLRGSISIVGARFDDLTLLKYKEIIAPDSPPVSLWSKSYFVEFGWMADGRTDMPNSRTIWTADKSILRAGDKVTLSHKNAAGISFHIDVALDKVYGFTVTQRVVNKSGAPIVIRNYSLISRMFDLSSKQFNVSHEGPVGVFNGLLKEISYKDLEKDEAAAFDNSGEGSWLGVSDKYWLTSIAPLLNPIQKFDGRFKFVQNRNAAKSPMDKFQIDYASERQILAAGEQATADTFLFAGAKELSVLDGYAKRYKLALFDRAIDFGWFYFVTKPMLTALKYCHDLVGNFGVSILIVTIIVKLLLFPLANKSYVSMNKMKAIQPEVNRIRELYADDKMKQNQEIMELYKRKKVSPLSGCLPMLIQVPILFSLYKVLFVTIEMRQAPFFGWVHDLSAPDPTTVFNLFGLLPFTPPHFLMIGAWPIIMAVTMFVQQSFSPEPADPVQAKIMKFLPLIFLFMFSSFPVGLIIYWAWSNVLSIGQQYLIQYMQKRKSHLVTHK